MGFSAAAEIVGPVVMDAFGTSLAAGDRKSTRLNSSH